MVKLLKIVGRTIGITLEWVFILIIVLAFAIRTSTFQTYLGEVVTAYLSEELDAELRIGKIDVVFMDKILLKDVFIRDQHRDTLASLEQLSVRIESIDLNANKLVLSNVALEKGRVGIKRDKQTGDYNYWFLTDYFDSGKKKNKASDPMDVEILSLDLSGIHFSYDDNRKGYSTYGVDYDHIDCKKVQLHAKHFTIGDGTFAFYLAHLSTIERSGLQLKKMRTYCLIDMNRGIFLQNLSIRTPRTKLFSHKFYMRMSHLRGVYSFEDSVTFEAVIDSSRVHLNDVSFFAPALEGMDEYIALSGRLSQRVKNLRIEKIDLRFGARSIVQGDFSLPDFRAIKGSRFKEDVSYAYVDLNDLKQLKLPKSAQPRFIQLDPMIERLGYVELRRSKVHGTTDQFLVVTNQLTTALGSLHIDNGLTFSALNEGGYAFERTANSNFDVYVDSFQLGKFIANDLFGKVNGSMYLSGVVGQKDIIRIEKMTGELNSVGFNKYNYSSISVNDGSFISNVFSGNIKVNDPHLQMEYDGKIAVDKQQKFDFSIIMPKADLGRLNFVKDPNASLEAVLDMHMTGTDLSNYSGTVVLNELNYQELGKRITIPQLVLNAQRGTFSDHFVITSNVANVDLKGKVNPTTIVASVCNYVHELLPNLVPLMEMPKRKKGVVQDYFDLEVVVGNPKEVLAVFAPEVSIASQSKFTIHYNELLKEESIRIHAPEIAYQAIDDTTASKKYFSQLDLNQSFVRGTFLSLLNAERAEWNDSLFVRKFDYQITTDTNGFVSKLKWNQEMSDPASFKFYTKFQPLNEIDITLKPSYFTVKNQLWDIQNTAHFIYNQNKVLIDHLVLERDVQFLAINGVLSADEKDQIDVNLNDIHIEEFSSFINTDLDLKGRLNGTLHFATPFTHFMASGEVTADDFYVNQQEVGAVSAHGEWDYLNDRIILGGDLIYKSFQTFTYDGFYYPFRESNDIDLVLDFANTDIQVANAFMDPEVLSDIKGKLDGRIKIKGNSSDPKIDGKLRLSQGSVKVGLLGTTYKMAGPIVFDGENSSFYVDNMPVTDEEGNLAVLTSTVMHNQFENWSANIDFWFDDETVSGIYNRPFTGRFLAMNTHYQEGDIYYGKAYASGYANILIQEGQTDITVNARSEKDTKITLPMYGPSDVSEFDFITFEDDLRKQLSKGVDLTGVNMELNLMATPEAEIRLVFNEKTGDIITARGLGMLSITADYLGRIFMNGQYVVASGQYNFVVPPIKQVFTLVPGGSITWTGNPYEANLDISAYNSVNASLKELTQDVTGGTSSGKETVQCIIKITNTLSNPQLVLDIDVPNTNESGKQALQRIKSNPDDLQKQFFTLLVMKRFVPLSGQTQQGLGGAADVLTEQINGALDGLTKDVKFKVGYDGQTAQNGNASSVTRATTFGIQTALGENKNIILTGAFGVANSTTGQTSSSSLIGDMSIEYLINDDGTFRVKIFNESNDKGVLTEKYRGDYTQGIGVHYQEQFNALSDSRMLQTFGKIGKKQTYQMIGNAILNVFRRKEKKVYLRESKKRKPIPEEKPKANVVTPPAAIEPKKEE